MLKPDPKANEYIESGVWSKVTLDSLFKKCVNERPNEIACVDPADKHEWAFSAPKLYSWQNLNAEIDKLSSIISQWKLLPHATVIIQLPNIIENIITYFALIRCNYVPLCVETIAGQFELRAAAQKANASAIITYTQIADLSLALNARAVAVEALSIKIVAAFGEDCPDGVTSLENFSARGVLSLPRPIISIPDNLPAHGLCSVVDNQSKVILRSHNHCIASGLMVFLETRAQTLETIICCTPILSPNGLSAALVPWLLAQGKLQLLQPFNDLSLKIALKNNGVKRLVVSGEQYPLIERFISAHSAPEHLSLTWNNPAKYVRLTQQKNYAQKLLTLTITDIINLNDLVVCALKRDGCEPTPLKIGSYNSPRNLSHSPQFLHIITDEKNNLLCSGAVVAQYNNGTSPIPLGLKCKLQDNNLITELVSLDNIAYIGGLRAGLKEIEEAFYKHPMIESVGAKVVLDDLFGQRIQLLVSGKSNTVNSDLLLTLIEKHLHDCGFSSYKSASEVVIMPNSSFAANCEFPLTLNKAL